MQHPHPQPTRPDMTRRMKRADAIHAPAPGTSPTRPRAGAAGPMTASLVGASGFAAIPTTALDLPLVQRLRRSPRFRVRVPIYRPALPGPPGITLLPCCPR